VPTPPLALHRVRFVGVVGSALLAGGAAALIFALVDESDLLAVIAGLVMVVGAFAIFESTRPYRFVIGPDGLDLRRPGIDRRIPWSEIDAVILDVTADPAGRTLGDRRLKRPQFFLVPADDADDCGLPLRPQCPVDDRPCALLLDTWDVREKPDDIAAAFAAHAAERFQDKGPQ
jgi:hypothetical protein